MTEGRTLTPCPDVLNERGTVATCQKPAGHDGLHVRWTDDGDDIVWGDPPTTPARVQPCCDDGPPGHTPQQHHDASPCFDQDCPLDHPAGGPFPHPSREH